jgi:hypothetical protein
METEEIENVLEMKSITDILKEIEQEFAEVNIVFKEIDKNSCYPCANGVFFSPGYSPPEDVNKKQYNEQQQNVVKNLYRQMIVYLVATKPIFQKTLSENNSLKRKTYSVIEHGIEHECVETDEKIYYFLKKELTDRLTKNEEPGRFLGPCVVSKNGEKDIYVINNDFIKDSVEYYNHPEIKKRMQENLL